MTRRSTVEAVSVFIPSEFMTKFRKGGQNSCKVRETKETSSFSGGRDSAEEEEEEASFQLPASTTPLPDLRTSEAPALHLLLSAFAATARREAEEQQNMAAAVGNHGAITGTRACKGPPGWSLSALFKMHLPAQASVHACRADARLSCPQQTGGLLKMGLE